MNDSSFKEIDSEPRDTLFDRLRDAVGSDVDSGETCPKCGSPEKEYQGWVLYTELWKCKDCGKNYPTKDFLDEFQERMGYDFNADICDRCDESCKDEGRKQCSKFLDIQWKKHLEEEGFKPQTVEPTRQEEGHCDAHGGQGHTMYLMVPSGRVGKFFGFKKDGWVCDACLSHSKYPNQYPSLGNHSSKPTTKGVEE